VDEANEQHNQEDNMEPHGGNMGDVGGNENITTMSHLKMGLPWALAGRSLKKWWELHYMKIPNHQTCVCPIDIELLLDTWHIRCINISQIVWSVKKKKLIPNTLPNFEYETSMMLKKLGLIYNVIDVHKRDVHCF